MKRLLPILLSLIVLSSCNKTAIKESRSFVNDTWMRFEPETFDFNINNVDNCYNIFMTVTIDTNKVKGPELPLVVNMTSDGGERRMFRTHITLKDRRGNRVGKMSGSMQTAETRVREYVFFNHTGRQTVEVKQATSKYELPGVNNFGIRVEKAKLVYPE